MMHGRQNKHRNIFEYFTIQTLLLKYCAFFGLVIKNSSNSFYYSWSTKHHWVGLFFQVLCFPLISNIPQLLSAVVLGISGDVI
jgi:hypothetical protein